MLCSTPPVCGQTDLCVTVKDTLLLSFSKRKVVRWKTSVCKNLHAKIKGDVLNAPFRVDLSLRAGLLTLPPMYLGRWHAGHLQLKLTWDIYPLQFIYFPPIYFIPYWVSQEWQMLCWRESCQHSIQHLGQVPLTSMTSLPLWRLCLCPRRRCDLPMCHLCFPEAFEGTLYAKDSQMFQIRWSHTHAPEIRFLSNNWALWFPRAHNLCLPFRNEEDCTFPIFAALLRVTGLVVECLYHSLCTASSHPPPPPQPPRPSSTSHHHMCPLWNGNAGPLKTVNLKQITAALMLM